MNSSSHADTQQQKHKGENELTPCCANLTHTHTLGDMARYFHHERVHEHGAVRIRRGARMRESRMTTSLATHVALALRFPGNGQPRIALASDTRSVQRFEARLVSDPNMFTVTVECTPVLQHTQGFATGAPAKPRSNPSGKFHRPTSRCNVTLCQSMI